MRISDGRGRDDFEDDGFHIVFLFDVFLFEQQRANPARPDVRWSHEGGPSLVVLFDYEFATVALPSEESGRRIT